MSEAFNINGIKSSQLSMTRYQSGHLTSELMLERHTTLQWTPDGLQTVDTVIYWWADRDLYLGSFGVDVNWRISGFYIVVYG